MGIILFFYYRLVKSEKIFFHVIKNLTIPTILESYVKGIKKKRNN